MAGILWRGSAAKYRQWFPRKAFRFLVFGSCNLSALRRRSLDSNSKYACLKCRALVKQHRRKLCIFLSFRRPPKRLIASTRETVRSRNTASPGNVRCNGPPCRKSQALVRSRKRLWQPRRRFSVSRHVMAVAFQVTVEAGSTDSQGLRSPQAVALA